MNNRLVFSVFFSVLVSQQFSTNFMCRKYIASHIQVIVAEANGGKVTQNCNDLCFCPCRPPGGGKTDVINPSLECRKVIKCATIPECSAEIMACQEVEPKELCFCPCRIPFCGPDVLYYPSQSCLQRIKCAFGQYECSAEYINGSGK